MATTTLGYEAFTSVSFQEPTTTLGYEAFTNVSFSHITSDNVVTNESATYFNVTDEPTTKSPWGKYGELEKYTTFWVGVWINRTYIRILNAIGIPGNMAALITILKLKPLSSSSLYIAFLACVDSLALIAFLLYDELRRIDLIMTDHGCRFLYYFQHAIIMISNWTLVCMTGERFIAIWFPFKVNRVCTKKNATIMFCAIVFFFAVLNSHFLFVLEQVVPDGGRPYCDARDQYEFFFTRVWYYIDFVFFAVLPCTILFVCNAYIIIGMQKSQQMQKEMNQKQEQLEEKMKQQRQVAVMLVTVSTVFIILTMPNGIHYIYKNYWDYAKSKKDRALFICVDNIIRCMSTINHAINFYFYFLTGRKFRNKFLEVFLCRSPARKSMYASTSVPGMSESRSTNVSTIPMSTMNTKS